MQLAWWQRLLLSAWVRPVLLVLVLLVVWDLTIRLFRIPPYLIPSPWSVVQQLGALANVIDKAAALNVAINLQALEDETFVHACRAEIDRLRVSARQMCDEVVDLIDRRLVSREVTS